MSYENAIMYNRVLPSYVPKDERAKGGVRIDGDDPEKMNEILSYLN